MLAAAALPLRDVQEAASNADPRTTMCYDKSWYCIRRATFARLTADGCECVSSSDLARLPAPLVIVRLPPPRPRLTPGRGLGQPA
jgi:hypothetical protein